MNYKLAKKLEKAGYPQPAEGGGYLHNKKGWYAENNKPYPPSLSELIEACGDDFVGIYKDKGWIAAWRAEKDYNDYKKAQGKTPEEAVAKLWLELNKKL